jgi:UDP-galactopyranose mutase
MIPFVTAESQIPPNQGQVPMSPLLAPDLICLSHIRWDFADQRPHHLMSHAAEHGRVFFVEEPRPAAQIHLEVQRVSDMLYVVIPHMPTTMTHLDTATIMRVFLEELLYTYHMDEYLLWYYSPLFVPWTTQLTPRTIVYDCTSDIARRNDANDTFGDYEATLLATSDIVFTNDTALWESKSRFHPNVHCFPSTMKTNWLAQVLRRPQPNTTSWDTTWAAMEAHLNAVRLQHA